MSDTYTHARQHNAGKIFRHADGRRYRYSDRADSVGKAYGYKVFDDGTESGYMELPADLAPEPYDVTETLEFAQRIKALGFTVYLAKSGTYGFITDETESRVLSFEHRCWKLSGNYGPPSKSCGTGWAHNDFSMNALKTADDVKRMLYAHPPEWCKGWKYFTTVAQYMGQYGSSSGYRRV